MWRTSAGDRVLRGAEWKLFRAGVALLRLELKDALPDDISVATGVRVYDALPPGQQLLQLALVAEALHDEQISAPELSAVNEATVAAVFAELLHALTLELDAPRGPEDADAYWVRQLIRTACRERADEFDALPQRQARDREAWQVLLDELASRILWDCDYALGDEFLDDAPDEAHGRMQLLGIHADYFVALAPEPTRQQVKEARLTLRRLLSEKRRPTE